MPNPLPPHTHPGHSGHTVHEPAPFPSDGDDTFSSGTPSTPFAPHAVTPEILAVLTGHGHDWCRAVHHHLFRLLDDIGAADGMIATTSVYVDTDDRRMTAAGRWLCRNPEVLTPADDRSLLLMHTERSESLAHATGSNPRHTFASIPHLLGHIARQVVSETERTCLGCITLVADIVATTIVTLVRLDTRVTVPGGVRVWWAPGFDDHHP